MYKQLTYMQRKELKRLLDIGCSKADIAEKLGVHIATIYRELTRGDVDGGYDPDYAEGAYREMIAARGSKSIIDWNPNLREAIANFILKDKLSVEQVVDRLQQSKEFETYPTTKQTLYSAIDKGLIPGVTRDSLKSDTTVVFSDGLIHVAKWIRDEIGLEDGDQLKAEVKGNRIIYKKIEEKGDR